MFPVGCILFILFLLALPFLLLLGYFHVVTIGFEKLGLSPELTIVLLLVMLFGSAINIPLTRRKFTPVETSTFFGFFKKQQLQVSGITLNVGGALIPIVLSIYFLSYVPSFTPVLIATLVMILAMYYMARIVPGRGITVPLLAPPLLALFLALILAPEFPAATAFIAGVLGTLIGADVLHLRKAQRMNPSLISIGGAGVFDGIFLVGLVASLLT